MGLFPAADRRPEQIRRDTSVFPEGHRRREGVRPPVLANPMLRLVAGLRPLVSALTRRPRPSIIEEDGLRRFIFGLFVCLGVISSGEVFTAEAPYKMGKGRYLNGDEVTSLMHDIAHNASLSFKKAFTEALREKRCVLGVKKSKLTFILFIRLEEVMGRTPLNRRNKPLFVVLVNKRKGVPERDPEIRRNTANRYYDIPVLSGHYVMFEKDLKEGAYTFLEAGSAE